LLPENFFIQISDTHLFEDPQATLWDVAPEPMLDRALEALDETVQQAAFVLVTGDCSADGSPASYRRLADKLSRLKVPVHYMPGNHDDPAVMSTVLLGRDLKAGEKLSQTFEACGWRFVLLDSSLRGEESGELGPSQLTWLRETLAAAKAVPTIVCVHHNPLPVGSAWLDPMMIADADGFLEILDASPQVRAVLFGHVHQVFEEQRDGTHYLSAPSTFFQFKPKSRDFERDDRQPGVRLIGLDAQAMTTTVLRLGERLRTFRA